MCDSLSCLWDHLCKLQIPDVKVFKRQLLGKKENSYSFHSILTTTFYGKYGNQGGIQAIASFGDLPNLNNLQHFKDVTSATLPLAINLSWFHLARRQADHQRPWASCFIYTSFFTM